MKNKIGGFAMNRCFQNLFVDPLDKTDLRYEGTVVGGKWMNGVLVSSRREWKATS